MFRLLDVIPMIISIETLLDVIPMIISIETTVSYHLAPWPVTLVGDYRCIPSLWGVRRLTTYGGASRWLKFQLPGDMFYHFSMEDGCSEHPSNSDSELPKQCVQLRVVLILWWSFWNIPDKLQMILTGSRLPRWLCVTRRIPRAIVIEGKKGREHQLRV